MTSGLQHNLFKILSIVEVTTASASELNFASIPHALNVTSEKVFQLFLCTVSANMHLNPEDYLKISLGTRKRR